jgi:hypothetical protein
LPSPLRGAGERHAREPDGLPVANHGGSGLSGG